MMNTSFFAFFLMAPAGNQASGGSSSFSSFIFMGAILLIMWFFMIRPQRKKQKEQKTFIDNLQKGDKIITIGGVHAVIYKLNEDNTTLTVEIANGMYIKIEKSAISMESTVALHKLTASQSTINNNVA